MATNAGDGIDGEAQVALATGTSAAEYGSMLDAQLTRFPLPPSEDGPLDAPHISPVLSPFPSATVDATTAPLVEPMDTFIPRLERVARIAGPAPEDLAAARAPLPKQVSHLQFQTQFKTSQGARGSCWAFAGVAALEAAYARINVAAHLSEQYLFHISKAHENHRAGGGINSLIGFQGSADVVHHLKYWAVPSRDLAEYINQPELQALANGIPRTQGGLANAAGGTREQADWFEYDLRNIPLMGRWFARYRVKAFGKKANFTNDDIRSTLAAGFDVVVDAFDKLNNGGHVLLIYGYDDNAQAFTIKNSQGLPGFETLRYVNDPHFTIQNQAMFWVTAVEPVETQWAAMWLGRWETDHDGWRGRLVIRRFLDIRADVGIPGPNNRISLGTWYAEDGRRLDVVGHFVDGGRGLMCNIGDQPFELYLHTRDPYRAGGRTFWNNTPFGVVMSRGTATGAGSGFDRSETIGLWDTVHDGWRGQLRIGVSPSYVQAADAVARRTWIDPGPTAHRVDAHIDFGGSNRDQPFQLLAHTREDGLLGGVTSWGGKDWPVEGRMSQNLYTVQQDGLLRWYRHTGRSNLTFQWDEPKVVGSGWSAFRALFGGGDGVVYAIQPDGVLLWYYHDGRNQGTFNWQGAKQIGTGWQGFRQVFAGDGGVIYGLRSDGILLWYRHLGRRDGSTVWQGPFQVGTGWNSFITVGAGPDGCLYGILRDGRLLWYRHWGHDEGYPIWTGRTQVGIGWQDFDSIWAVGNGYVYGRTIFGDLWLWRHHGFLTGEGTWSQGAKVGVGWGGNMVAVFTT
jgi:hypothetical protein